MNPQEQFGPIATPAHNTPTYTRLVSNYKSEYNIGLKARGVVKGRFCSDWAMWGAGDDYIHGEDEDEQGDACDLSVDESLCANVFEIGAQPRTDKVSVCPGRKRRIVKVTQWSASARANIA